MDQVVEAELKKNSLPIGEMLLARGLLEQEELQEALAQQQLVGDALGQVLSSSGTLRPRDVYETLALQQGVAFADLYHMPPQEEIAKLSNPQDCVRYRCIPWKREGDTLVFASASLEASTRNHMQELAQGKPYRFALTSPRDILHAVEMVFGQVLDCRAREYLLLQAPHYSLRRSPKRWRAFTKAMIVLCIMLACSALPSVLLPGVIMVCNLFYLATIALKPMLFLAARSTATLPADYTTALPKESDLPIYTVLVPLYQEEEGIDRLLKALNALDYPPSRLDVKLIIEADDTATEQAILAARPPGMYEILRVPYSLPRTKPKACNYALSFARGEFVTIFDAEDIPPPDQLKKAVALFRSVPDHVICLQARLNYYNREENLLTRLFAIEYGSLFNFMLPGLYALGIPIPLGGTSNHLRIEKLRELGEWDPYNVTEDADIGIRLAAEGFITLPFDSLTQEEAPVLLGAWLKQRARWIKGYMQTWQVAMRDARSMYRRFGPLGFVGFQLFVGAASLVYLLSPFLWIFSGFWAAGEWKTDIVPDWIMRCSVGVFATGLITQWVLAFIVVRQEAWRGGGMAAAVVLYPFYWILHSLASFRALWQLIFAPSHWDKTPHGLSRLIPA